MITAIAPTNIAILKYWGKNPAWEEYLIPTKSSLSFTVDKLYTTTTVSAKKSTGNGSRGKIDFSLNGKKITTTMKEYEYVDDFIIKVGRIFPFVREYDYKIVSENNFPTSAGFASSASGFAALIKAIAGELPEFAAMKNDDAKLSALSRLGSGSATRSIPTKGGVVLWNRGLEFTDRRDPTKLPKTELDQVMFSSFAQTLFTPEHWDDFVIVYTKVKAEEKKIKSRAGMKSSIDTNPLYPAWIDYEEGTLKDQMIEAVKIKDFDKLGRQIMLASNNLHQICFGTYPPIVYLNQTSLEIIDSIHELNGGVEEQMNAPIKAAYTFDAGPNAVVFTLKKNENSVASMLSEIVGEENVTISKMGPGAHYSSKHLI